MLYVYFSAKSLKFAPKWPISYFQLTLAAIFYHSNGKSQIMGVVYALAIVLINLQEEIGEKQFPYFNLMGGGGAKSPLMLVAL